MNAISLYIILAVLVYTINSLCTFSSYGFDAYVQCHQQLSTVTPKATEKDQLTMIQKEVSIQIMGCYCFKTGMADEHFKLVKDYPLIFNKTVSTDYETHSRLIAAATQCQQALFNNTKAGTWAVMYCTHSLKRKICNESESSASGF